MRIEKKHAGWGALLLAACLIVFLANPFACGKSPEGPSGGSSSYDPLAAARASLGKIENPEATVPPQCYTKTESLSNPCWTCHAKATPTNHKDDWKLQEEYAFSEFALTNHWKNLFRDNSSAIAEMSDEEILSYVREDNYTPLYEYAWGTDYTGWRPDLDFRKGFDEESFARDGSEWRAFRYKPFLGTFWPTNGSTDDVFIRLPPMFRRDGGGNPSRDIYKINLALLETSLGTPWDAPLERDVGPLNETLAGFDLDGSGAVGGTVTKVRALPASYVGGAAAVPIHRNLYPQGTEFLHTVRYIDPDAPSLLSARMKEVRYSRKFDFLEGWAIARVYENAFNEKEEGKLPGFGGSPLIGLRNDLGWLLQAFIEDGDGRLRAQTHEEHQFCMGCHTGIGVTVDQTFSFPRKVPGLAGWGWQDARGIKDVPQAGHGKPEILTYFERVKGGDEFRANAEVLGRFFPGGVLDETEVRRAAPGGDKDIAHLVAPSRERALLLDKAYRALVLRQDFAHGRDAIASPPGNVHPNILNGSTGLAEAGIVHTDGVLWLDWNWQP
ncbi:MAG: hypothetical protein AB1405_06855 [Bdellovibrionota bacterium]